MSHNRGGKDDEQIISRGVTKKTQSVYLLDLKTGPEKTRFEKLNIEKLEKKERSQIWVFNHM